MMKIFLAHGRRDARRAVIDEFCDFGHGRNLEKPPPPSKVNCQTMPARFIAGSKSYSDLRALRLRNAFATSSPTNISVTASHASLRLSFIPIHAAAQASRLRADC